MRKGLFLAVAAAAVMSFAAGCYYGPYYPGYGYGGGGYAEDTYYYYPDYEVYYYPRVGLYYWFEGGDWRYGQRLPERFVLRDRDRVTIRWPREPHRDHDRVRREYPANREANRDQGREQPRGDQGQRR